MTERQRERKDREGERKMESVRESYNGCWKGVKNEFQTRQRPFSKIHHTLSDFCCHLFSQQEPRLAELR